MTSVFTDSLFSLTHGLVFHMAFLGLGLYRDVKGVITRLRLICLTAFFLVGLVRNTCFIIDEGL